MKQGYSQLLTAEPNRPYHVEDECVWRDGCDNMERERCRTHVRSRCASAHSRPLYLLTGWNQISLSGLTVAVLLLSFSSSNPLALYPLHQMETFSDPSMAIWKAQPSSYGWQCIGATEARAIWVDGSTVLVSGRKTKRQMAYKTSAAFLIEDAAPLRLLKACGGSPRSSATALFAKAIPGKFLQLLGVFLCVVVRDCLPTAWQSTVSR